LFALLDRVPPVRGRVGRPRQRPDSVVADRGYDHDKYRRLVWRRGVKPMIARRETEHGSGLGRDRWVVELTFAWLHNRRRLLLRTDRRHQTHEAFLDLACCLICWRRIETSHLLGARLFSVRRQAGRGCPRALVPGRAREKTR
jgi:transposase